MEFYLYEEKDEDLEIIKDITNIINNWTTSSWSYLK